MEYVLISICLLVAIVVFSIWTKMEKLEARMKGMQTTIDQIANHLDIPENPINDELRKLIKEGKDIKAVKKAREMLGLSLLEGKEYIDKLKMELIIRR
ncbi:hypothetical protein [Radiobacillus deserti]|uniref:Ribosomal protein L7/L12 C-terminal domain-containing protein n=1 Tax=Radiobacillus deserti TaxID=2594883 RepID=A0A516KJE2_9BACI|nr:hypothetical protein [Radiobacillus deserti]QDP41506.1 hypothetical protein FN924_15790 [Radiobacillus deserti]